MSEKFGRVYSEAMMLENLSLEAKGIYSIICVLCGSSSCCYPKVSYLAKLSGKSRSQVSRYLKVLQDKGIILRYLDKKRKMTMTVNLLDPRNPFAQSEPPA
jgi:DNA-binding transcriptional ArsR family regulator